MTQAPEVERRPLGIFRVCPAALPDPLNSKQVCEIVSQVADEVRAEVRAGTWRPPATLGINPWRLRSRPGQPGGGSGESPGG